MPRESSVPGSPQDWLRYARADLAIALGPLPEGAIYELLCFHAQQAVEKSIKAVLLHHGRRIERTHSIERLVDLLPESLPRQPELIESARLTPYAVLVRYPGVSEPVTEADHQDAVRLARGVVSWAEAIVVGTEGRG